MPRRIQRKRTKGWRMPEGVINCTRPGPFGNPIKIGMRPCDVIPGIYDDQPIETMRECWEWFHQVMIDPCQWEKMIGVMPDWAPPIIDRIHELKGKDLALLVQVRL